jgi:predicted molibdopterin-dependent oxidoreductase YjgC
MPRITIDDRVLEVAKGRSILEAARQADITIPTLCAHKDLSPHGSCRLCVVEVEGLRGRVTACTQPIADGMVIRTETPALAESRRFVLDPGTPILHVGKFTRGLGKFHVVDHLPPAELPNEEYPFVLTTGRVLYHWHGGEMTRRASGLTEAYPEPLIEISPDDAARIGLNGHTTVRVRSRRGETVARAVVTDRVAPGIVFGSFHFPGSENINNVTTAAVDPTARIPEYKVCAVRVEAVGE